MVNNKEKNLLTNYRITHFTNTVSNRQIPLSLMGEQVVYEYSFNTTLYMGLYNGRAFDGYLLNLLDCHIEKVGEKVSRGTLLGHIFQSRKALYDKVSFPPIEILTTPDGIGSIHLQAFYALSQENITYVLCDACNDFIKVLQYIMQNWDILANDIANTEDAERAEYVRKIMQSNPTFSELISSLWPKLHSIVIFNNRDVDSGLNLLRDYCSSKIQIIYNGIVAPEGVISTSLSIDNADSILLPDSMFYEFRRMEDRNYNHLLTMNQVELCNNYELVITNLSGFYRYRTGKTVCIVGQYHNTPMVRLAYQQLEI